MCVGEGVFGDCLEEHDTHAWPWEGRHTHINKVNICILNTGKLFFGRGKKPIKPEGNFFHW